MPTSAIVVLPSKMRTVSPSVNANRSAYFRLILASTSSKSESIGIPKSLMNSYPTYTSISGSGVGSR